MKRILFVGLIALLVLLAVPTVMAAAETTAIGEYKANTIELSITSTVPTFGQLKLGWNEVASEAMPIVHAKVRGGTVTGWEVKASNPTWNLNKGHMWESVAGNELFYNFWLSNGAAYQEMNYDYSDFFTTGGGPGEADVDQNLWMKQYVASTDADGNYHIAIAFTGMVA